MQPQDNSTPEAPTGPQIIQPDTLSATPTPAPPPQNQPEAPPVMPSNQPPAAKESEDGSISWTASEFIAHQKNAGWYLILAGAAVVIGGLVYLLTRDVISTIMVVVALAVIAILASKQPRTLSYTLDSSGIRIGDKIHSFADFKSFSVIEEGAVSSIVLMPMKRFMPMFNMYFDPKDEDRITALLDDYLPYVEGRLDLVERLMRQIRF